MPTTNILKKSLIKQLLNKIEEKREYWQVVIISLEPAIDNITSCASSVAFLKGETGNKSWENFSASTILKVIKALDRNEFFINKLIEGKLLKLRPKKDRPNGDVVSMKKLFHQETIMGSGPNLPALIPQLPPPLPRSVGNFIKTTSGIPY